MHRVLEYSFWRVMRSVLCVALTIFASLASAQPSEMTYREFVKAPSVMRSDKPLQAYLLGIGYAIRADYACNDNDSSNLRSGSALIEELLAFAKTDWGRAYLEMEGNFGVMSYPMTVGDVMLKYYTQHSRCQRLPKPREQLAR